jgi:hypothetical protein
MIPVTSVLALDDSFDRADTSFLEYTNDDDGLGNGWRPVSGTWRIGDNKLELKAPGIVSRVILLAEPKLTVPFTVSVEVIALTSNREPSAGLAFFAKDAKQFYVFRICAAGPDSFLQFNATDNGEEGMQNIGGNLAAGAQFQENTPYRLTVRCTTPGTFDFTVVDVASGETLVSNSVRDPQSRFTEGQVGIYSSTAFSAFDNFSFKKE